MKLYIRAMVAVALFAAVSLVPALHAQSETVVRMNVPFGFNCGAQHFEPGTYTLEFLDSNLMLLRKGQAGEKLIMYAREADLDRARSGRAVFTNIGGHYFLDEIWVGGSAEHASISERKWEKRAELELALGGRVPTHIEVALLEDLRPVGR